MGLAFSSPPYFDLEDYTIGKQSYNPSISYKEWQENYLIPTLKNIYLYLNKDGILALNIKNGKTYKLADDAKQLAEQYGFQLINIELLNNNQRITSSGLINNAENIFIFKKKENKKIIVPETLTQANETINNIEEIPPQKIKSEITPIANKLDIYLIGVKSKKQLEDKNIYNSDNSFLGERYFATFPDKILTEISYLNNYKIGKYIEMTK